MTSDSVEGRPLRVLVVGGLGTGGAAGGREHAMAWAAARSPRCEALFCAPANGATPGTAVPAGTDLVELCAVERIDLALIGPDASIEAGIVDRLTAAGVMAFGPTQAAAELEWSKAYTRAFCERHGIASPRAATFTDPDAAIAWAVAAGFPVVVKADGLAAGKGVLLPDGADDTAAAIRSILIDGAFGTAGARVVLEERLVGEEISLLAFCDGTTAVAMPPAQDHKRAYEGDRGPNTGGMGAYAPAPVCPPALAASLTGDVLQRVVTASAAEGRPFVGVLYAGIMLTADGPRLLEFNCRFGDPEAQVLLPLLDTDFLDVAEACCTGRLRALDVKWWNGAAVTVVVAADGYPGTIRSGDRVQGLDLVGAHTGVLVFHGGTHRDDAGDVITTGGRVLSITGLGSNVAEARTRAYEVVAKISFEGMQFRRDIGWRALARTTGGYAASGVDIDAGNEAVALIKTAVESTHTPAVLAGVGAFGGVFDAKALAARCMSRCSSHRQTVWERRWRSPPRPAVSAGVGRDLVNHCVNDILVQNARPLFFLDYIASAKPRSVSRSPTSSAGCRPRAARTAARCSAARRPRCLACTTMAMSTWPAPLIGMAERTELLPRARHPLRATC